MSYEIMSSRTRSGISLVVLGEQCLFPVTLDPESNLPAEWQVQDDNGVVSFVFYVLCFMFYVLCYFGLAVKNLNPTTKMTGKTKFHVKTVAN